MGIFVETKEVECSCNESRVKIQMNACLQCLEDSKITHKSVVKCAEV